MLGTPPCSLDASDRFPRPPGSTVPFQTPQYPELLIANERIQALNRETLYYGSARVETAERRQVHSGF